MFLSLIQNAIDKKNDDGGSQIIGIQNPMNRAFNKFNQVDNDTDEKRKYLGSDKELKMDDIKPIKPVQRFENEVRIELDQFSESSQGKKYNPGQRPSSRISNLDEGKLSPEITHNPQYKKSFKIKPIKSDLRKTKVKNMRSKKIL